MMTMRMAMVILMPIWRQADKLPVSKRWGGDPIKDISDHSHWKTEYYKHHMDSIWNIMKLEDDQKSGRHQIE